MTSRTCMQLSAQVFAVSSFVSVCFVWTSKALIDKKRRCTRPASCLAGTRSPSWHLRSSSSDSPCIKMGMGMMSKGMMSKGMMLAMMKSMGDMEMSSSLLG